MRAATIPEPLAEREQFVLWQYEEREGKPTKVPYQAAFPWKKAVPSDPATWARLDRALQMANEADGVGFVFTSHDPFAGIDLDGAITDDGELEPWAAEIVEELDSYAERSPSKRGIHVIVRGHLHGSRRRAGRFEVYSERRFFTLTGDRIGKRETIEERQEQLDAVVARLFPEREAQMGTASPPATGPALTDDSELLDKAFAAKNGAKVEALYRGELNGHASHSEADLALCSALTFYTQDHEQLDRLFRGSGLMRDKWEREDYRCSTIAKALERREVYQPPQRRQERRQRPASAEDDLEAKRELSGLLDLPSVGVELTGARIVGHGLRASCDLFFSNDESVTFDSLRDVMNPTLLKGEVTFATGALPKVTGDTGQRVLKLLRGMAEREESLTEDEDTRNFCLAYLQTTRPIEFDVDGDTADRWRGFSELRREEQDAEVNGVPLYVAARLVLVSPDVRGQPFCDWVRKTQEPKRRTNADIHTRVLRVGWERRASEGRINARRPGFKDQLNWAFLEVPADWEGGLWGHP